MVENNNNNAEEDKKKMDIINVSVEKQRYFYQIFDWYRNLNDEIRFLIKFGCSQQKLLLLMDKYISSLKINLRSYICNTNRSCWLAKEMTSILFLFKDLNRTSTETHEYLVKICQLLGLYTFMELKFSSKFTSSKVSIAERISSNYDIHLKNVGIYYVLRIFLYIPTFFHQKEIMTKIFQKYLNRNQHFTQTELPDTLYCMYLIAYKKWISLEIDDYEIRNICDFANNNIKPMITLFSNSLYAPCLPEILYTKCDVTKQILSKPINTKLLSHLLKRDGCKKKPTVIIDLSESDTSTNTPSILEDTNWTNLMANQQKNSVKIEAPLIIQTIDLTIDDSFSWEISWLNELIRKARTSVPSINVFASNLAGALEIINIQDDDDDGIEHNTNESKDKLISAKTITLDDPIIDDLNNQDMCKKKNNLAEERLIEEKAILSDNVCLIREERTNDDSFSKITKNYMFSDKNTENITKSPSLSHANNNNNEINLFKKKSINTFSNDETVTKDCVNPVASNLEQKNPYNSKKTFNFNVNHSFNDLFTSGISTGDTAISNMALFANDEDTEDINSPPVESFSESDADELVQLIEKNTKEYNETTNLFLNREKHQDNIIENSETLNANTVSNSNIRKVSFAKLPEKHIATSNYFSNKNMKNAKKNHIRKEYDESTIKSSINSMSTSVISFNQPNICSNTLETAATIKSTVQDLISSTDTSLQNANHQNKVSGKIDYLFMKKFPPPTYRKSDINDKTIRHDNKIKLQNRINIKKIEIDKKQYKIDKKPKSDFDRYLEKLKEKRDKTMHKPKNSTHTNKKKGRPRKILNIYDDISDVRKNSDIKLHQKTYVKIEKIDISHYSNNSKLNKFKKKLSHESTTISINPYVRLKRIRIFENIKNNFESTNTETNIVLNNVIEGNYGIAPTNSILKNSSEINSTVNDFYSPIKENQIENNVKVISSFSAGTHSNQRDSPTMYKNILDSVNDYEKIYSFSKQRKLKDPESEVTSTQDNCDLLSDYKISSTQDIFNTKVNNSVQNNEIDTSNHGKRRKSSIYSYLFENNKTSYGCESNLSDQIYLNKEHNEPTTTTLNISTKKKRGRKKKNVQLNQSDNKSDQSSKSETEIFSVFGDVEKSLLTKKRGRKKKIIHLETSHNSLTDDNDIVINYSQNNNQLPNLPAEKYLVIHDINLENSTVAKAKTYSMLDLVSNVFVPKEVENNFDKMT